MDENRRQENGPNTSADLAFRRLFDQESLPRLTLIQRMVLEQMRHAEPNQLNDMWAEQFRLVGLHTLDKMCRQTEQAVQECHQNQGDRDDHVYSTSSRETASAYICEFANGDTIGMFAAFNESILLRWLIRTGKLQIGLPRLVPPPRVKDIRKVFNFAEMLTLSRQVIREMELDQKNIVEKPR
jgi:hypothetical protein